MKDNEKIGRRSSRVPMIAVIAGVLMGLLGTAAGFYVGILKPAIDSGRLGEMSSTSLYAGVGLIALVVLASAVYFVRLIRSKKRAAQSSREEW